MYNFSHLEAQYYKFTLQENKKRESTVVIHIKTNLLLFCSTRQNIENKTDIQEVNNIILITDIILLFLKEAILILNEKYTTTTPTKLRLNSHVYLPCNVTCLTFIYSQKP